MTTDIDPFDPDTPTRHGDPDASVGDTRFKIIDDAHGLRLLRLRYGLITCAPPVTEYNWYADGEFSFRDADELAAADDAIAACRDD